MEKKFALRVIEKYCKQCGICAAFCPNQVLEQHMGQAPKAVSPESCIGCRMCQLRCPDLAIEVEAIEQ